MIGSIIYIMDQIDPDIKTYGTIRLVEQDNDIPDLQWYYVMANDEMLNVQFDPRIGNYWRIIENTSEYIISIQPPTM